MPKPKTRIDVGLAIAVAVAILAITQFVVCTSWAMAAYPGGDYRDQRADSPSTGYDWNHNWLSDLGRSRTWSGKPNTLSAGYFNSSIIGLGAGLLIFFLIFHRSTEDEKDVARVMQACGAVSSLGLVALGLTPVDLRYEARLAALAGWIIPMPVMAFVFAFQCFRSAGFIGNAAGMIAFAMAIMLAIAILFYAAAGSPSGYVVMQKIVVAISIIWFLLLAFRVSLAAVEVVTISRIERINQQAERYSAKLQKGHRK